MKLFYLTSLGIFLWGNLYGQAFEVVKLLDNGSRRIQVVILGDGYQANEQTKFINNATAIMDGLFTSSPFKEYKKYFNVSAIKVPSPQSGADHPGTATDVTEPVFPVNEVNTFYNTTFDYAGIHRLVVPNNVGGIVQVLAQQIPDYDQVFMLVNSTQYGGSGGFVATSTIDKNASEISLHEIGHSFASLADEYYAGDQFAWETFNMTMENNANNIKWKEWLNMSGVGIYQHCCGGNSSQWYKPHKTCRMEILGNPFCLVCRQRLVDRMYELINPIINFSPQETMQDLDKNTTFKVEAIKPTPNSVKIEWRLNGNLIKANADSVIIALKDLSSGKRHELEATFIDSTSFSKTYLPSRGFIYKVIWNIALKSTTAVIDPGRLYQVKARLQPALPTQELTLHIQSQNVHQRIPWSIFSVHGQPVQSGKLNIDAGEQLFNFDVGDLPAGVYLLTLFFKPYPLPLVFIKY